MNHINEVFIQIALIWTCSINDTLAVNKKILYIQYFDLINPYIPNMHTVHVFAFLSGNVSVCLTVCSMLTTKLKAPHYWPFVRGLHRWTIYSREERPETRKIFQSHDIIMLNCMEHLQCLDGIYDRFWFGKGIAIRSTSANSLYWLPIMSHLYGIISIDRRYDILFQPLMVIISWI